MAAAMARCISVLRAMRSGELPGGEEGQILAVVDPVIAPLARVDQIEGTVDGDAVQPGREGRPRVEAGRGAVGPQKRLLHDVVGIGGVAGDAVCRPVEGAGMPLDQNAEGLVIAAAYPVPSSFRVDCIVGLDVSRGRG